MALAGIRQARRSSGSVGFAVAPRGLADVEAATRQVNAEPSEPCPAWSSCATTSPAAIQYHLCCGDIHRQEPTWLWLNCNGAKEHSNTTEFVTIGAFQLATACAQLGNRCVMSCLPSPSWRSSLVPSGSMSPPRPPSPAWAVAAEKPEAHWPGSSDASGTKPAPEIRGAVAGLGGNADATRSCGL